MLTGDACSRPLIIIRFYNLHVVDIRKVVGEIVSYHKKDYPFFFFWFMWVVCLLAFPFFLPCDGSSHRSFIEFLCL